MATLTQLENVMKTRHPVKRASSMAITHDNSKVLGRITDMRTEKVRESQKFGTNKMKTHNSAWTPVVNKASNEQIFTERSDLVSHWFDLWTDSQRKRFFDQIFRQCGRRQYKFVQDWFQERVPLQHLDFATVLPRFLSLYVMSFLEPKSLSRCAQVCWHWKLLADQDVLWMAKCLKYGWYLPYSPPEYETGSWKRHYIACAQTLDYVTSSNGLYGMRKDGSDLQPRKPTKKEMALSLRESDKMLTSRPPWVGPDYKPKDLDKNMYAFLHDFNPNEPNMPKSALLFHNRWGILKKKHGLTTDPMRELGLSTQRRREGHRALTSGEDFEYTRTGRTATLSETLGYDLVNPREQRVNELVNTEWYPPVRTSGRRPNLAGGTNYPGTLRSSQAMTYEGSIEEQKNPRVVLISSRVPAAELLLDGVLFGVIPVVYEYEGTTAESLSLRVEQVLQGRQAQSIGLFCHCEEPGEIRLVHGCNVSMNTLDYPDAREFFEIVSGHVLPTNEGGQFDVFAPLAASESGMELMVQLTVLTGIQFSSPTGIIGNYNHVNTDWCIPYKEGEPPKMYFCQSKLNVWANTADQAQEALRTTRKNLTPYFEKTHRDIAAQLAGEMVFSVLGQTEIYGVRNITAALQSGLKELGTQSDRNPLEFLGEYLLQQAGVSDLQFTGTRKKLSPVMFDKSDYEEEDDEEEVEEEEESLSERKRQTSDWDEDGEEEHRNEEQEDEDREAKKDEGTEKAARRQKREQRKKVLEKTQELSQKFGTLRSTGKIERLTSQKFSDHPEKRTPIAMEILSSEVEYNRLLQAIRNVYFKPLNAALKSNRAIISNQNLQIIFSDVMGILQMSKDLTENLKNRLLDWDAQDSCLGDIFVQFCTHLKVYTNFVNNNEVILRCIERCKEQTPSFRAFLKRNDRTPETKMLTLQEMLLLPSRRINDYVMLLSWFEVHTPKSHQDRVDLSDSLMTLTELDRCIRECKLRMERDREMIELQRKIQNCPALLEANRYLIKHLDVCGLNPPKKSSDIPELQVYQHVSMNGLFLFNDALVITRRMSKHYPFSRAIEYTYKFEFSVALGRMRVHDIPESKSVKNGFKVESPKQQWFFAAETQEEKFNMISLLEQTIRGAMQG